MTGLAAQLLVLAKTPVPGRVKTRLSPAFSAVQAATLAEAALLDTMRAVTLTPVHRRVLVLDGTPGEWATAGPFDLLSQRGDGLDQRIANAFEDTWIGATRPMLLIGMDTPQITSRLLTSAVGALLEPDVDAVLGLADDGGYWAIGLREPQAALFLGIEMSTDRTGSAQLARLREAGLRVQQLPRLRDVDTPADAATVSAQAPLTSFAKTWSAMVAEQATIRSQGAA